MNTKANQHPHLKVCIAGILTPTLEFAFGGRPVSFHRLPSAQNFAATVFAMF